MGLLLGLPLRLLALVFALLRLLLPVLLVLIFLWLLQGRPRRQTRRQKPADREESPPHFDGPVYTVDYEAVEEDEEEK